MRSRKSNLKWLLPLLLFAPAGCAEINQVQADFQTAVRDVFGPTDKASQSNQKGPAKHPPANPKDLQAAYRLALQLSTGPSSQRDPAAAARLMKNAADLGHREARYVYGVMLFSGKGGPRNQVAAARYWRLAARQGHAGAQYLLGKAHGNGAGVRQDAAWAARWYGKAAEAGHRKAQFGYGVFWAKGHGLPRNPRLGLKWLLLAGDKANKHAPALRRRLSKQLGPEATGTARKQATAFKPRQNSSGINDRPTVIYVQYSLRRLGRGVGGIDGRTGPKTRFAIAAFRAAKGLKKSSHIDQDLLRRLRAETARLRRKK